MDKSVATQWPDSADELSGFADSLSIEYANTLLADLGCAQAIVPEPEPRHPALTWARSGLMSLTGGMEPVMCPVPIAACADGVIHAMKSFGINGLDSIEGSRLLTERAACMGLSRKGRIAPGGSCRLIQAVNGRLALNLARDDDWAMMPAWLETDEIDGRPGQWDEIEASVRYRDLDELVSRGRLLGLAVAADGMPVAGGWYQSLVKGRQAIPARQPVVLDLSALWAGPLCGHLLQKMGARVIKVESTSRPDGAREGNKIFHDLLNSGKASVALDLSSDQGRQQLAGLIEQADIVIESSRPRALRQMGIIAEELVQQKPGLTWISISAYGRAGEASEWVGFGDDIGVAGGLSSMMQAVTGNVMFVGDAIADPLTGMHAALAGWATSQQGGGQLLSISMRDVVSHVLHFDLPANEDDLLERQMAWSSVPAEEDIRMPRPRRPVEPSAVLGADTREILAEFGLV